MAVKGPVDPLEFPMVFTTFNPATGEKLAGYEEMNPGAVEEILETLGEVQPRWGQEPVSRRVQSLLSLSQHLKEQKGTLASLMTSEMGKPLDQAEAEIEKCAWLCEYYAEVSETYLEPRKVDIGAYRSMVTFQPMGNILGIMPWNFPFWQVLRFSLSSLMAGNGILLKHAPSVFGCALAIEKLFLEAGFPEGLFRSLIIDIAQIPELIHHPLVHGVSVTGSVPTGRAVATEAGKALKKCVLELGGSDPFIILEDANLDKAVEAGLTGRFQNSGQVCAAAKRFIVAKSLREDFEKKFLQGVRELKMGDPTQAGVKIGPLARMDLRDRLAEQVSQSVAQGAVALTGGEIPPGPGAYYPPTVLTDITPAMPAFSEELFGPVATVFYVSSEAEALSLANATPYGLSGMVFTQDLEKGERMAREGIEAGLCFVNDFTKSDPRLPFGGTKQSGFGRELSEFGLHEFTNIHTVVIQKI
jgi:succinate-semialdehyde dehydrogenase/glutarate-semialdehyde dehydrogenase